MPDTGLPPEFSRYIPDLLESHAAMVAHAVLALPFAAALGGALAFRPRRRGTPTRSASVIETQIVLAIIGAVVMLIVGASLARAFGVVGVAGLVRYRAKIEDPKDAVVMLACLSLGLACGVELYGLAVFSTVFLLLLLWVVESLEPEPRKLFELKIVSSDPAGMRSAIETVLRRHNVTYELRTMGPKEIHYEAQTLLTVPTDRLSNAILMLDSTGELEVMWEEKKKKK